MAKRGSKRSKSKDSVRLEKVTGGDIRREDEDTKRMQNKKDDSRGAESQEDTGRKPRQTSKHTVVRRNRDWESDNAESFEGEAKSKSRRNRDRESDNAESFEGKAKGREAKSYKDDGRVRTNGGDEATWQVDDIGFWRRLKNTIRQSREKRINPHKSFKRSYREDYVRETAVPGVMHHIFASFGILFKNWKIFLPLVVLTVVLNALFVGVMDETNYVQFQDVLDYTSTEVAGGDIGNVAKAGLILISTITTGGLSGESSEAATVFGVLIFLIIWLTTIFLLRHLLAGHKVRLRDGLYNAMTPLISTFLVFAVAVIQCVPIFVLIIVYSAAVQTDFLATPFYALVFFIFAALMLILSGYLLSSSLIAMLAVSVPGMYPMKALHTASDLMMGRRIKFILRIIALLLMLAVLWTVVMLPLILFDMWMKNFQWTAGIPFVPVCMTVMTCFTVTYITAYLYLYYRWMLDA